VARGCDAPLVGCVVRAIDQEPANASGAHLFIFLIRRRWPLQMKTRRGEPAGFDCVNNILCRARGSAGGDLQFILEGVHHVGKPGNSDGTTK
jgi:hypothetical protein